MNQDTIDYYKRAAKVYTLGAKILELLKDRLSDKTDVNFGGGSLWFYCRNPEDKAAVMSLCRDKPWCKRPGIHEGTIDYLNSLDDIEIRICASETALPGTCVVVEVDEVVPARTVPASIRKVKKVVCNEPINDDSTISPTTPLS